jgi:polar amino acid transport system substrate-binding protein
MWGPKSFAVFLAAATLAAPAIIGAAPPAPLAVVSGDFQPFTGKALPEGGFVTALVERAFVLGGRTVTVEWLPWNRGYSLTVQGQYAGTFPYIRTAERERDLLYSDPLYKSLGYLYSRKDHPVRAVGIEQAEGLTIAVPLGFSGGAKLDPLIRSGRLKLVQPPDLARAFEMVSLGRADFLSNDELPSDPYLKQFPNLVKDGPIDEAELFLVVPKVRPDAEAVLQAFNTGLRKMRQSGEYAALLKRFTPAN